MKAQLQSSSIPKKRSRQTKRLPGKRKRNWTCAKVLRELDGLADPGVRAKMAYFGIRVPSAHGISAPVLHKFAREIGKDHRLAKQLWLSGIHEAKILARLVGDPDGVTASEMDSWAGAFVSWVAVDTAGVYFHAARTSV